MRTVTLIVLLLALVGGCGGQVTTILSTVGPVVTDRPVANDTPEPTQTTTFAPIAIKGKGDKVAKFATPEGSTGIAAISNSGRSNFVVESVAADGSTNDLLVNVIGAYAGTVLFDANEGEHTVAFKITSSGSWAITIKPVASARRWDGKGQLRGKGDDVVIVSPATSGLATAAIAHTGKSNFYVTAYAPDGRDLLVNDIGEYHGEQAFPDGTFLLSIGADGSWAINPT